MVRVRSSYHMECPPLVQQSFCATGPRCGTNASLAVCHPKSVILAGSPPLPGGRASSLPRRHIMAAELDSVPVEREAVCVHYVSHASNPGGTTGSITEISARPEHFVQGGLFVWPFVLLEVSD